MEAYEGLCVPTTLPGGEGLVRLITEKRLRGELEKVLKKLGDEMHIEVLRWGEGAP